MLFKTDYLLSFTYLYGEVIVIDFSRIEEFSKE
jgi:hypothetical protein